MLDRRSEEVLRSRRRAAWIDGTVCDCLARRSVCSAAPRLEASLRTMRRHWPAAARTAAAPSINRPIRRHQVCIWHCVRAPTQIATENNDLHFVRFYCAFVEKASLLSRLFRRSGRSKQRQIETFSAQFPPAEWFNSKAVHLHSVGTQTRDLVSVYLLLLLLFFLSPRKSLLI